jgi:hypothetical protein
MENYCVMHSNEKASLEKALDNFAQLENAYVILLFKVNLNFKLNSDCFPIERPSRCFEGNSRVLHASEASPESKKLFETRIEYSLEFR